VGSGPEEERLRQLADGDDRILFPGYRDGACKTAWYAAADLFVFPSLHDPWGLVVNEAMAFGLPIIASDAAGCVPDLLQDNGLVVPAGDTDALEDALAQLLRAKTRRRAMGNSSREIISKYTVEFACSAFLQAIEHALGKP
jgi:glycosyltransferase involved in cell wall biosynthesis